MRVPESPFERYMSKQFFFRLFHVFLRFWGQRAKKHVCNLPYSISVKSYRTFSRRAYIKPHIKLKLIGLATKILEKKIVKFFTTSKCERLNHLLNVTCQSNFFFAYFMCSSISGAKELKNMSAICHIQFQ